jgi:tetratricopeptide (TPR) repeat protein
MTLHAKLLGKLEFSLDGQVLRLPSGRALEVLVFLAVRASVRSWAELEANVGVTRPEVESLGFGAFRSHLEFLDAGAFLNAESDVQEYFANAQDLRVLARLRGVVAPDLESSHEAFRAWLAHERFAVTRTFLVALLDHGARLEAEGRTREAEANLAYVVKQRDLIRASSREDAARLTLELSRYHWRLNRPEQTVARIREAIPDLEPAESCEANINLAAALVRYGRPKEALEALTDLPEANDSRGWALVHRGNAERWLGSFEQAILTADEAFRLAKLESDGYLAVSALTVKGEVLLERAIQTGTEPKDAVIAFGQAIGIAEVLGEDASTGVLAGLAHAHAVWGSKQKALDGAEKAFKRARAARDGVSATRALLALYATTQIGGFARNALMEARACRHKPFEMLALIAVAEKERDPTLAQDALGLAQDMGSPFGMKRAKAALEALEPVRTQG